MCGIVGFVGSERAVDFVMAGLQRLEYRGYDSAGIATIHQGKVAVRRREGKLAALAELLRAEPSHGDIAIGHTRWATHGRPCEMNAHPQASGDVVVVHNGIVENYLDLRAELIAAGRTFTSETDTEVIAHLVALAEGATLAERVRTALRRLHGSFAVAVISERSPDGIVVAKNASPLIIGVLADSGMIASDIPALLPYTRDVIVLEEGEVATLWPGRVAITDMEGKPIERAPTHIDWTMEMAEKDGHEHFMHKEIHEQPRAMIATLRAHLGAGASVNIEAPLLDALTAARRVVFTAAGTSYHACLVGRLALEELARIGCEVELASELRYRKPLIDETTLVVAVSQSGETADTLAAIRAASALGSRVVSVVNVVDSSIARSSDWVLYTNAGPEISVASTKAFTTQVTALVLLAIAAGLRRGLDTGRAAELLEGLRQMPRQAQEVLDREPEVARAAQALVRARSALYLGRGYAYPVALEGALKLKEISYIHAEGYAAGELKHGPIALVTKDVPSIVVATRTPVYDKVLSNIQEVRARSGPVLAVASEGDNHIAGLADWVLRVPDVDPLLSPLLATIPLQLLAYHVASLRGTDIDQPRNLAKSVTVE